MVYVFYFYFHFAVMQFILLCPHEGFSFGCVYYLEIIHMSGITMNDFCLETLCSLVLNIIFFRAKQSDSSILNGLKT